MRFAPLSTSYGGHLSLKLIVSVLVQGAGRGAYRTCEKLCIKALAMIFASRSRIGGSQRHSIAWGSRMLPLSSIV